MLAIGVDPGYGETGMVAVLDGVLVRSTSFALPATMGPTIVRTNALAATVAGICEQWISEFPEEPDVLIALETPIMSRTRNTKIFGVQCGYVAAVANALWEMVQQLQETDLYDGQVVKFVEVGPSKPKKALTGKGSAKKDEMVEEGRKYFPPDADFHNKGDATREALADALGIALAGLLEWSEAFDMSSEVARKPHVRSVWLGR